jgi:hypothetical protein
VEITCIGQLSLVGFQSLREAVRALLPSTLRVFILDTRERRDHTLNEHHFLTLQPQRETCLSNVVVLESLERTGSLFVFVKLSGAIMFQAWNFWKTEEGLCCEDKSNPKCGFYISSKEPISRRHARDITFLDNVLKSILSSTYFFRVCLGPSVDVRGAAGPS